MTRSEAEARLKTAAWLAQPEAQQVFDLLDGAEGKTRAVGGVVRDTILGLTRQSVEFDLATELPPAEVTRRAERAGIAAYPTGIEHGTVTLKVGNLLAEVTTLRQDIETDGRHARVTFGTDWRRDAERRDFTLNALYSSMAGELFDPLDGLDDCLAGRVRFIGDPDRRIAEDRLRVFRFFRFSASHADQRLDAEGLAACRRAANTLERLSAERVGAEMRRILSLGRVAETIEAMVDAGILDIPEVAAELLREYELRAPAPCLIGRLALLGSAGDLEQLRTNWGLSNREVSVAKSLVDCAELLVADKVDEARYRYPMVADEAVYVAAALGAWDGARTIATANKVRSQAPPAFPITGDDLVVRGIAAGPQLGAELRRLEQLWIESGFVLSRESLLAEQHD